MGFSCVICKFVISCILCCYTAVSGEMKRSQVPNRASIGKPVHQEEVPEEFFDAYRPSVRQTGIDVHKALDRLESGHNDDFEEMGDLPRIRERLPGTRRLTARKPNMSTGELKMKQRFIARKPSLESEHVLTGSRNRDDADADAEEHASMSHPDGGDYRLSASGNRDLKNDHDFNSLLNSVKSNPIISKEQNENEVGKVTQYDATTPTPLFKSQNKKRKNKTSKLSRLGRLYKELAERMVEGEMRQSQHAIPQTLLDEETFDNSQPISIKDFMSEQRNLGENREQEIHPKNDTLKKMENVNNADNKKLNDSSIRLKEPQSNDTEGNIKNNKTANKNKSPQSKNGDSEETKNKIPSKSAIQCGNMTCENGGTCDPVGHKCVCAAGFKGDSCDQGSTKGWFKQKAGLVKQKLKDHIVTIVLSVIVAVLVIVISIMMVICLKKRDVSGN